jgi:hypothetical protein
LAGIEKETNRMPRKEADAADRSSRHQSRLILANDMHLLLNRVVPA